MLVERSWQAKHFAGHTLTSSPVVRKDKETEEARGGHGEGRGVERHLRPGPGHSGREGERGGICPVLSKAPFSMRCHFINKELAGGAQSYRTS